MCSAITEADRWFVYNGAIMNRRMLLVFTMTIAIAATGCNKNRDAAGGSTVPAKAADAVQQKLMEVAGSGATDCGRFPVQTADVQLKTASDCAMQAAQSKKPFYVGYDMPGMTVAVAGDNGGKLYSVQVQERGMVSTSLSVRDSSCSERTRDVLCAWPVWQWSYGRRSARWNADGARGRGTVWDDQSARGDSAGERGDAESA